MITPKLGGEPILLVPSAVCLKMNLKGIVGIVCCVYT